MRRSVSTLVFALSSSACNATPPAGERAPSIEPPIATFDAAHAILQARPLGAIRSLARPPATAPLQAIVPLRADHAVRLAPRGRPGFLVDVTPLDVASSPAGEEASATAFHDVALDTDLLYLRDGAAFEELRVLRRAPPQAAPVTLRWSLALGPAVATARLERGHLELADAAGFVALSVPPPRAIDARQTVRALDLALLGEGRQRTLVATLDARGLVAPIVVDPLWSAAATMQQKRTFLAAVVIPGPRVLLEGGVGTGDATAEIYDPTTNKWTAAASMLTARTEHAAAAFKTGFAAGKVLVAGGSNASVDTSLAEIYDPATNKWSATTAMPSAQASDSGGSKTLRLGTVKGASAAVMTNATTAADATPALFDPATKTWTNATNSLVVDAGYDVVELSDGRAFYAGGRVGGTGPSTGNSSYLFDATTRTFTSAGAMTSSHAYPTITVVGTKALVLGGITYVGIQHVAKAQATIDVFDPATGWSSGPSSQFGGTVFGAAMRNGSTYVFEGDVLSLWKPGATSLTPMSALIPATFQAAIALDDTRALFLDGAAGTSFLFELGALGAACDLANECASGVCLTGLCCESTCGGGAVCNPPRKGAGHCAKLDGASCSAGSECDSGSCVDGVCCASACTGVCQACNVLGSEGTCVAVAGAPRGVRAPCASSSDPCKAKRCDGVDGLACNYPGGAQACGATSCAAQLQTNAGACDGHGACATTSIACGAYACGASACSTTCAADVDCAPGFFCDVAAKACAPKNGLGTSCVATVGCAAGLFCTDGVCCAEPACGAGGTCASAIAKGRCLKQQGAACIADDQCATARCVDGVCCDAACAGACEACDVTGSEGTCTPVTGAPHGARAACGPSAPADACAARVCDGTERASCVGFAGAEVECRPSSCAGGVRAARGVCDGKGACPAATTSSCSGFACAADGVECRTVCGRDAECSTGFRCSLGKCVASTDTCADGDVVRADGSRRACAPFACVAGRCATACATSDDCALGYLCGADGACVSAPSSSSSGGCTTTPRPASGDGRGGLALAVFAAALVGLRKRQRALHALGAATTLGAATLGLGCSERASAEQPAATDAGVAAPLGAEPMAWVARTPMGATVARRRPLSREGARAGTFEGAHAKALGRSGFAGDVSRTIGRLDVDIALGADGADGADGAHEIVLQAGEIGLRIEAEGARGAARLERDAVVVAIPAAATSVVHVALDGAYEELRVLDRAPDDATFAWRLAVEGRGALRLREGRVELVDPAGVVRLASAPMFAVDADGTSRALGVALTQGDHGSARLEARLDARGLRAPIVVDPLWSVAAAMVVPSRASAAAVQLADGRVALIGGMSGATYLATAEAYTAASNTWASLAALPAPRSGALATVVPSGTWAGRVVVVGGTNATGSLTTAVVWTPSSNTWATMAAPPTSLAAITGAGPSVLGTSDSAMFAFDPSSGAWTTLTAPPWTRHPDLVTASNGTAFAAGGKIGSSSTAILLAYDPTTKTLNGVSGLSSPRYAPALTAFGAKILIAGGYSFDFLTGQQPVASADVLDPATGAVTATAGLLAPVGGGLAAPLGTGAVVIGGTGPAAPAAFAEQLDAVGKPFTYSAALPAAITSGAAFGLSTGAVFVRDTTTATAPINRLYAFGPLGAACIFDADCASGACVNGVCCGTASCATGASCALAGHLGTCMKPPGIACASGECASGFCVDGLCCDAACGGQCESCDMPGSRGACTATLGAPHGARAACAGGSDPDMCKHQLCDGSSRVACKLPPSGTTCGANACSGGRETHRATCDAAGTCTDLARTCAPFACGPAACNTTCATDSDCDAIGFCQLPAGVCAVRPGVGVACGTGGACASGLACVEGVCCTHASCPSGATCAAPGHEGVCVLQKGQPCAVATDCASNACVDGYCCDGACNGPCEACDVAGSAGTCTPVVGAPHAGHPTCSAASADVCSGRTCDGADRARCAALPGSETACRAASCEKGVATAAARCDGTGKCPAASSGSCGGFACDATTKACRTTCAKDTDCADGFACGGGTCKPPSSFCADDGFSVVDTATGASTACAPYRCIGAACARSCETTDDCAPGNACDPALQQCRPAAGAATTSDGGGCGLARGTPGAAAWSGALAAACVAAARRRRRRSGPLRG
jgi:hypothetical protein